MRELTIAAKIENVEPVTDFVNELLSAMGCPLKAQMQIDVAIDEIFSNIAYYAYPNQSGDATVRVEKISNPYAVVITFIDSGIPYNPLAESDPDITLSAEERQIGGLGVYMVKKTMDDVRYEYRDGKNIFSIQKKL